jgi:hypothetical protein
MSKKEEVIKNKKHSNRMKRGERGRGGGEKIKSLWEDGE